MTIWGNVIATNTTGPDYAETDQALSSFIRNKPDAAIAKAQTTADSAQSAANKAQTAAGNAQTAAQAAQTAADGKVSKLTREAVLSASLWSGMTQTVAVDGVTASNTVLVSPHPEAVASWGEAAAVCIGQDAGTLTFRCAAVPTVDLRVNVVILN